MAFLDFLKKKKEVANMATTDEREENKAREDIADKGKDPETERDREDESVAAQERERGDEDSQTAKDRIDESRGAKEADGKRDGSGEEGEHGDERQDSEMFTRMFQQAIEPIQRQLTELSERVAAVTRNPQPAGDEASSKLRAFEQKFMN